MKELRQNYLIFHRNLKKLKKIKIDWNTKWINFRP